MVALTLLAMLAGGLFMGTFWARAISIENARRVSVMTMAEGLLLQVLGESNDSLDTLLSLPAGSQTFTLNVPVLADDGAFSQQPTSFTLGSWTQINLAIGSDSKEQDTIRGGFADSAVAVRLRPMITTTDFDASDPTLGSFYLITLDYQFQSALGQQKFSAVETVSTAQAFIDD